MSQVFRNNNNLALSRYSNASARRGIKTNPHDLKIKASEYNDDHLALKETKRLPFLLDSFHDRTTSGNPSRLDVNDFKQLTDRCKRKLLMLVIKQKYPVRFHRDEVAELRKLGFMQTETLYPTVKCIRTAKHVYARAQKLAHDTDSVLGDKLHRTCKTLIEGQSLRAKEVNEASLHDIKLYTKKKSRNSNRL